MTSPVAEGAAPSIPGLSAPAPVSAESRLIALDALRGFACMGILLMNIVIFGLHDAAYDNPTSAGGSAGANLWVWVVMHVLAEGKMRAIFSLVFGASVVLLTSRWEGRPEAADLYFRRTLWLLVFGVAHAYLLWLGEILYPYALCGLILYPFRNLSARALLSLGLACSIATSSAAGINGYLQGRDRATGLAAVEKARSGVPLSEEEAEAKDEYEKAVRKRNPTADDLEKHNARWRGGFLSVVGARAEVVYGYHAIPYYHYWMADIWSMIFLGMGLFKNGFLRAAASSRTYLGCAAIGLLVGIGVNSYTAWVTVKANFDPVVQTFTFVGYDLGRFSVALAWISLIQWVCRSGLAGGVMNLVAAIGRTAFSNYILQSVLCTLIFTGIGFGLYGRLQRYQLYGVVLVVWAIQLVVTPLWLRHFRFGPLEWAWRSLTYWKRQPLRRER